MSSPIVPSGAAGPDYPRWSETLLDHRRVVIRPIAREDAPAEREFIEGLSEQARHYRFLGGIGSASERLVRQLTDIDHVHDVAFVAVDPADALERIVGVSRYSTNAQGDGCECAVTVGDQWQKKGLGTLLMKHLIEVAKARGIRRMTSLDAADNFRMQELADYLGFTTRVDPDDAGQVIHELDLGDPGAAR